MSSDKDLALDKERIQRIVKDAVESVIQHDTAYDHSKVTHWVNNIIDKTMKATTGMNKPFKYIVTCVIVQNNGAGFHTASSCYWESTDDSYIDKFEGQNLYCITSVYWICL